MTRGRRTEHCRTQIMATGARLFTQQGYHATGLKEILDACQVPKGSFYNFFESKEHFAIEILEHYRTINVERWETELARMDGCHFERLYTLVKQEIERFGSEHNVIGCLLANFSGEVSQCSPRFSAAISDSIALVKAAFTRDLLICQQEGSIRTDLSATTIAELLLEHWLGALLRCKADNSLAPLNNHLILFRSLKAATSHPPITD